jgi:DNA modification methylase
MPVSNVQQIATAKLRPNPANTRKHSKRQVAQLADIIKQVGFLVPIVADENFVVQAGHGRLLAAQRLGLRSVPVITVSGISDAKRRAYVLADNRLTEAAGWDRPGLAAELSRLAPLLMEEGLSIDLTGFKPAEIDGLMGDLVDPERDPADEIPQLANTSVSKLDDVYHLGESHRLMCGDALLDANVRKLMGSARAAMVFTDPPYNVRVSSIGSRGKIKHREFAAASGEMTSAQYRRFLSDAFSIAAKYSDVGSIHYVCIDWRHLREILDAGEDAYTELKNLIVWVKTNAGQGAFYRSQHELICVFKNGDAPHLNNFELGQYGRRRSNVWTYAGVNAFRAGRLDELSIHPTVKPVALVIDAMRDCSRRGDIIFDPFSGAGTTILAAERVGRCGYGLEIDPLYVDTAIRRWQDFTRRDAILKATGQTFDEVAVARSHRKRGRAR